MKELIQANSIYSSWELTPNQRKRFEYTGSNLTAINLEKLVDGVWVLVLKQELTYDVSDNLLTITAVKL